MKDDLKIRMYSVTIDCRDTVKLAGFYAELLGWRIVFHNDEYCVIGVPNANQGAYPCITFQHNPAYQPPVWPEEPDKQQKMEHLDLAVNNLEKAVQYAEGCGAKIAEEQFSDDWTVMLDPEGHPFCLCQMKPMFESVDFALL